MTVSVSDLSGTGATGSGIPESIAGLTTLQALYLASVNLRGATIPAAISKALRLEVMYGSPLTAK
mgnify:CR=1 FL=1